MGVLLQLRQLLGAHCLPSEVTAEERWNVKFRWRSQMRASTYHDRPQHPCKVERGSGPTAVSAAVGPPIVYRQRSLRRSGGMTTAVDDYRRRMRKYLIQFSISSR